MGPVFVLLMLLLAANLVFLSAVATVSDVRVWYREHYRWYAAFAVLTGVVAASVSLQRIVSP